MHEVQVRIDRMRELLQNMVNVQELKKSKELVNSIEDDAKRATINSTKLRAAAQNVDYPAFAALVSCSHLKPMTRKELDSRERKDKSQERSIPAWSFDPAGTNTSIPDAFPPRHSCFLDAGKFESPKTTETAEPVWQQQSHLSFFRNPLFESDENVVTPVQTDQKLAKPHLSLDSINSCQRTSDQKADKSIAPRPERDSNCTHTCPNNCRMAKSHAGAEKLMGQQASYTSDSFLKEWRRLSATDSSARLQFLSKFSPTNFPALFKVEIPPFLLGEILDILLASLPTRPEDPKVTDNHSTVSVSSSPAISSPTKSSKGGSGSSGDDIFKLHGQAMETDNVANRKCNEIFLNDVEKMFVHWVVSIMESLKNCGRFELAVKLIGQTGRRNATLILNYIAKTVTCVDSTHPACKKDVLPDTTEHAAMECVTKLHDAYCNGRH